MHRGQVVQRDNLFRTMRQVQMPVRGVPERLVPRLVAGPEPERPGVLLERWEEDGEDEENLPGDGGEEGGGGESIRLSGTDMRVF